MNVMLATRLRSVGGRCLLMQNLYCRSTIPTKHIRFPTTLMKFVAFSSSGEPPLSEFELKNKDLMRPMSPHLTIYKAQLTTAMSLLQRVSGMIMTFIQLGFSYGALFIPGTFPQFFDWFVSLQFGPSIIYSLKLAMSVLFSYHICNAVRHLSWDMGHLLTRTDLYRTGYIALGATFALAVALAAL